MKTTSGRRWLSLFLAFVLCFSLAPAALAAAGDPITISQSTLTLEIGKKATLTLNQGSDRIPNKDIAWTITGNAAQVDSSGQVTAVAAGTSTVTATYDKVDYTCTVTVPEPTPSITIDRDTDVVTSRGLSTQLKAITVPAGQTVRWESSDPSVASVSYLGLVTALKAGETTITASVEGSSSLSDTVKVIVAGMTAKEDPMTVEENKEISLDGAVECFGDVSPYSVTYTSQNTYVAEINGTTLIGRRVGEATIEARANNGAYRTTFTVKVVPDSSTRIPETGTISLTTNETLPFTDLNQYFTTQLAGKLTYVTGLLVSSTKEGTLYYNYNSEAEPGWGVAQVDNYYRNPGPGQRALKDITFVPKPDFTGGNVTISYTAFTEGGNTYSCTINLTVTSAIGGVGNTNAITYTTKYNTAVKFDANEFGAVCREQMGANLDYVTFSLPNERQGTLYSNYTGEGNYGSRVTLNTRYSTRNLDDIWFVPAPGFEGTVTIYYTGFPRGSSGKSYTGQVLVTVGKDSASSIGGLSYEISKGGVARFDDVDFNNYCKDMLDTTQNLSFIQFDSLPSASQGTLYYEYRSASNPGTAALAGTTYYYGARNPRIDRLAFVPAADFVGIIRIPFTGRTVDGTRFAGNVEVNVRGGQGSGTIEYTCSPGKTVSFDDSNFNQLCRDLTNSPLDYIQFQSLPNSADGTLRYGSQSAATGRSYYRGATTPRIDNLSFRASNSFSGAVDIPFTGTATSGESFDGVVTVTTTGSSGGNSSGSSSSGNISYSTDSRSAVIFDREDFDDLAQWEYGRNVSTVRFSLPGSSQGDLYRNYRSSSSKGTRITSSNTSISASDLDRVAFIPASGYSGTVYLDFTARTTTSNEEFTGTVEIDVERPGAENTVRYTTQTAPVNFRSSDFGRSGSTLSSIQFGSMPSSTVGYLYYRYSSPTSYDRQASTSSIYRTSGSNLISDLTFVPRAGYSGTVTLPYTGTNSNGSTFEGEVIITVSPVYSSRFTDMNAYSNAERAAVAFLYDNGVTSGISSTQYGPALPISRGDFAVMIYRAFGLTPSSSSGRFNDVPSNVYYAQAVNTLASMGIVSGVGNNAYLPTAPITRQDAICIVQRAARAIGWSANDGYASVLNSYSDGGSVGGYAKGAMSYAVQRGYLPLSNGQLAPNGALTRVDMAQILHRVLTY